MLDSRNYVYDHHAPEPDGPTEKAGTDPASGVVKRMTPARAIAAVMAVLLAAAALAAACGAPSQFEILQTAESENKIANATATAAAFETVVAKGLADPSQTSSEQGAGGQGGFAGELRATAAAEATATAQAGGSGPAATATASLGQTAELPPGDPLTGEVVITIGNAGRYDPEVVKVKVGTKVTWENTERTTHQTVSDPPGQAEVWDSGPMARPVGITENVKFSHTFTKTGRYTYASKQPTDAGLIGVIFVVD